MHNVSRRNLAKGLAWATPPVVFTTFAPTVAASKATCMVSGTKISYDSTINTVTATFSYTVGAAGSITASASGGRKVTWTSSQPSITIAAASTATATFTFKASTNPGAEVSVTVTANVTAGSGNNKQRCSAAQSVVTT